MRGTYFLFGKKRVSFSMQEEARSFLWCNWKARGIPCPLGVFLRSAPHCFGLKQVFATWALLTVGLGNSLS